MTKRVLMAGLLHATNTFVPGQTTLSSFRILPSQMLWRQDGGATCLSGGLQAARERDWHILPVIQMMAHPGGVVADAAVEHWWQAFEQVAIAEARAGIDGIWLNLHGAMVSEGYADVEGELLRRIRLLPMCGQVPIGGVLDLHANFTAQMAEHSNALIAYRKNPHTDGLETAADSARLLDDLMRHGQLARTVWERPPLLLPPAAIGTASEPMCALEARAREIEAAHPDILAVNVFAGFAYADVPEAGVSFSAVTVGDIDIARRALRTLTDIAMGHKQHAWPMGLSLDEALDRVQTHFANDGDADGNRDGDADRDHNREGDSGGPVLIVEPADNMGAGAPGDLTIVLAGLLERGIQNAGVTVVDAEAVREIWPLMPGEHKRIRVGGRSGVTGAHPLELDIELITTSDGKFMLEDPHGPMATNSLNWDMGLTVVVRGTSPRGGTSSGGSTSPGGSAGVTILISSSKMMPMDLAMWRSQGVRPEDLSVINIKAAVAHRQAYDRIARASYTIDTPGPCANDVRLLPYQRLRRPVYPLDEV